MELTFQDARPSDQEIANALTEFDLGEVIIQQNAEKGVSLRFKGINEATHAQIISKINALAPAQEAKFEFIGPSIGQELKNKTELAIVLALLAITIYITFAFRKVSKPVPSWKYGVASLLALSHDVLIPLGIFSLLGKLYNVEITIPIIAALLTILGFSVHDTIIIFDRIRENILKRGGYSFEDTVNWSLNQTVWRSISTVLTVLFVLLSIFFFGGKTLKYFSLALIFGIVFGAYSSIFIASPLLVSWLKRQQKARMR